MNRNLPVKWWQRPQLWRPTLNDRVEVRFVAGLMWDTWELSFPYLDDEILRRTAQPSARGEERVA